MKKKIQKPFDIEAAKNGAKVETRDGLSVMIVCYDRKGNYPIIALIDYGPTEGYTSYTIKGKSLINNTTNKNDLVIIEEVEDSDGYITARPHSAIDNNYHLWTLKDAEPGNILVSIDDNRPFIFRGLWYDGSPTAYCGMDTVDCITVGTGGPWTYKPVRPATYKERQRLFNKLEEKGYKWEAETLTLWEKCN